VTSHDFRFPGESAEYRQARDELLEGEVGVRRELERLAEQRRALPLGGAVPTDYIFEDWDPQSGGSREIRMSELFAPGKDTLFLYSFMIVPPEQGLSYVGPCPSCTSIIDAIDGAVAHITHRLNFAVIGTGPIGEFRDHGQRRGWRHVRLLSPGQSSYSRDYGAESVEGHQWPMATVFVRRDGVIHHLWSSELFFVPGREGEERRHVDFMWPMWAIFDRTPEGRGTEAPRLDYPFG
jgi:predicted dithiol-disulfide oxidoreductase (DUF899 family)